MAGAGPSRVRIERGIHLYRQPRSPNWTADVHVEGVHVRRSTGTSDLAAAKRAARELAASIRDGVSKSDTVSLYDVLTSYLEFKDRGHSEVSGIKALRRLYPDRPVSQVTAASVYKALASYKNPATVNRLINTLKAALNLALANEEIDKFPRIRRKPVPPPTIRRVEPAAIHKLRAELPQHLLAPYDFAVATGLRRSNVCKLTWGQVHLQDKMVTIPGFAFKQRRNHAIPLGSVALQILQAQPRTPGTDRVFTFRGKPFNDPWKAWDRARERANLKGIKWHDLRHTWASELAMAGAPTSAIKTLGGWASDSSVAIYTHLSQQHLVGLADLATSRLTAAPTPPPNSSDARSTCDEPSAPPSTSPSAVPTTTRRGSSRG